MPPFRRCVVPVLISLLLLAGGGPPSNAYIMDADNRRPMTDQERWKFQSVGIIAVKWSLEDRLRRIGTAILARTPEASHDVVVTAAHNFINHRTGRPHGNEFYFLTMGGEAIRITAASLGRTFSSTGQLAGTDVTRDWATALLETQISGRYGALGLGVIDSSGLALARKSATEFVAIGYNPESRQLMISDQCTVVALRERIGLIHDCDTKKGWSGGPLIMIDGGVPWVIGVSTLHVTARRERHHSFDARRHFNAAAPIGRDLRDAILRAAATGRLHGDNILNFSPP